MNRHKEYLIAHLIYDYPAGSTFYHTPLHMTVLPWFMCLEAESLIAESIKVITEETKTITTVALSEDKFGPQNNIEVMVLERESTLVNLHSELLDSMRRIGATWGHDEAWIGEKNWQPHVRHQVQNRLHKDDVVIIDTICLLEKEDQERKILSYFKLIGKKDD